MPGGVVPRQTACVHNARSKFSASERLAGRCLRHRRRGYRYSPWFHLLSCSLKGTLSKTIVSTMGRATKQRYNLFKEAEPLWAGKGLRLPLPYLVSPL